MTEIQDPNTTQLYKASKVLRALSDTDDNEQRELMLDTFSILMKEADEAVWPNHTHIHKKDTEMALRIVAGARPTEKEIQQYEDAMDSPHPRKDFGKVLEMIERAVKRSDLPSAYE